MQVDLPLKFVAETDAAAHARLSDVARMGTWAEVLDDEPVDNRVLWWIDEQGVHVIYHSARPPVKPVVR